jgi:hypothetical protein
MRDKTKRNTVTDQITASTPEELEIRNKHLVNEFSSDFWYVVQNTRGSAKVFSDGNTFTSGKRRVSDSMLYFVEIVLRRWKFGRVHDWTSPEISYCGCLKHGLGNSVARGVPLVPASSLNKFRT